MAQNTTITLTAATWTLITNSDTTAVTFQNQSFYPLLVKGTVGASAPANSDGAIEYAAGEGETNIPLDDLWPGIVATRVYVFCTNIARVMTSHT
jgi:hypothetical protein